MLLRKQACKALPLIYKLPYSVSIKKNPFRPFNINNSRTRSKIIQVSPSSSFFFSPFSSNSTVTSSNDSIETEFTEKKATSGDDSQEVFTLKDLTEEEIKKKILSKALLNVPKYDWDISAVTLAMKDLGISAGAHTIFERGAVVELIEYFLRQKNQHVFETITKYKEDFYDTERNNSIEDEMSKSPTAISSEELLLRTVEEHFYYLRPYLSTTTWLKAMALLASKIIL